MNESSVGGQYGIEIGAIRNVDGKMDDEWIAEKGLLPAQTLSMSGALSSDDTTVNTDRPLSELPVPTCFGSVRWPTSLCPSA